MNLQHQRLASGKWLKLSFLQQMANIGSEVQRTILWKDKKNAEYSHLALFRALELIDLTVADVKNVNRLREILRVRELLVDYFLGDNIYASTDVFWQKYFYAFNYAANLH